MWAIKVRKINNISPIEGADKIEVAFIGEWPCVVQKGKYAIGDLVVYCPTDSLIPQKILEEIGLVGKLAGSNKDRVKAIRLRGQLSIGILLTPPPGTSEGDDVADYFGITKYEAPVPVNMSEIVRATPRGFVKYDIENINNDPYMFAEGEEVYVSCKLDGTNASFGIVDGEFVVNSRNMSLQRQDTNLYWQIAERYDIERKLRQLVVDMWIKAEDYIYIYGEIFGKGVQSLHYGLSQPEFCLFDIRMNDQWMSINDTIRWANKMDLVMAPHLYTGPYHHDAIRKLAEGLEPFSGKGHHVNEGCVIRPMIERRTRKGERVIAKYINPEYLLL